MHPLRLTAACVLAMALASCDNQTAQSPQQPAPADQGEQREAKAPVQTGTPPSTGTPAANAPAKTDEVAQVKPPVGEAQTGASSAPGVQSYQGRTYIAGPVSLQLNADRSFVMDEVKGERRVEGRYTFQDGVLTFSDARGDIGPEQFPMRCRFQPSGADAFRLGEEGGSCGRFKDLTFKASG